MKKKFRSLELAVKTMVTSFNTGSHISLLKDSISEIDTIRQYQPGDKRLDSKSSLRTNLTMSRVFAPEKEITLYIILDVSSSQQNKAEATIMSSLFLSYIADITFDKVCLISFSDSLKEIVLPTNDTKHVNSALESLYLKDFEGKSNIDIAINYLVGLNPNNSLIFFISDFTFDLSNRFLIYLKGINSNPTNKSVALTLINTEELQFKSGLSGNFVDLETGDSVNWSGGSLKRFYEDWLSKVKYNFNKAKSDYLLLDCAEDYLKKITKYLIRI